jgi:hypothetical protein
MIFVFHEKFENKGEQRCKFVKNYLDVKSAHGRGWKEVGSGMEVAYRQQHTFHALAIKARIAA